jgi:ubiquinone/menaquinone biosynthesis C-methylase UbiE
MNAELHPYQKRELDYLNHYCDYTGMKILEIGGNPSCSVAKEFLNRGAQKVITINNKDNLPYGKFSDRCEFVKADARKMEFEAESFDIVFGVAVLEHILELDEVLEEINRVLNKNGFAFLHGGPLWSCARGHHLWIHVDGTAYKFNDNNPIPPWHHLIYNKSEMREFLESKNISSAHTEKILNWVYNVPNINRYYYEDYIRFFEESVLSMVKLNSRCWGSPPGGKILELLRKADNGKIKNHTFGEIEVLFKKE